MTAPITNIPAEDCLCGHKVGELVAVSNNREVPKEDLRPPEDGDITVCAKCGHIWAYNEGGKTKREPTEKDMQRLGPVNRKSILQVRDLIVTGKMPEEKIAHERMIDIGMLDRTYLRGTIAGVVGSYSLQEFFDASEGGQVYEWFLERLEAAEEVEITEEGMLLMLTLMQELRVPVVSLKKGVE